MKITIKSKSPIFRKFIEDIDNVVSKTQLFTADGGEMDVENYHFQDQRERLSKISLDFETGAHPAHIINEFVATDLIYDELAALQEEADIEASNV